MSSFLYPNGFTRQMMNENLDRSVQHFRKEGKAKAPVKHTAKYYKEQKRLKKESMIARAQRLTEEKGLLKASQTTQQVKGTFTKMVSKVRNFIAKLFK